MNVLDSRLAQRFNAIPDKILAPEFLQGHGLGNEISFYVFDYPPQCELQTRAQLESIERALHARKPELRVLTINLFDLLHDYLVERKLWDKVLEMQDAEGNESVKSRLKATLQADKVIRFLADNYDVADCDAIFLVGVGNAYPLLRSHSILNNLHAVTGQTPLVLFFPGDYDGDLLRLFGCLAGQHYYRAFQLVP